MEKKVLLVGGTGALGVYLTEELLNMGYWVDVVSLDHPVSHHPRLNYYQGDAKNPEWVADLLKREYQAVVDFMIYPSMEDFACFDSLYLENTDHYLYLSSYRVYDNKEHPIRETSPRLLDMPQDSSFVAQGEYAIYKAEGEERLRQSGKKNWTILRPAITYSKRRFQLTILEANVFLPRMQQGKTVILPGPALQVQGTMSWAGDFGKMVSRLVLNPDAMGEAYTISTAEHHSWQEIAEIYREVAGLKYMGVDTETFLEIVNPGAVLSRQQLLYDRYFDRIIDNGKILNATGLKQSEFMPLKEGLALELGRLPRDLSWGESAAGERMDAYLQKMNLT